MKIQDALVDRAVLRKDLGAQWPVVLLKAVGKSRALFRRSDWATSKGAEASFVRRLALPAAIYSFILDMPRFGKEDALRIAGELIRVCFK
jgi:hypothetical protein